MPGKISRKPKREGGSDIPGAACGLAELALELGVLCVSMKSMDGASLFSSLSLLTFLRFKGAPFDSRSQVEQIQSPTGTLAILQHWTCAPLGHFSHNSMTIAPSSSKDVSLHTMHGVSSSTCVSFSTCASSSTCEGS
jgi:hypothetical protein